MGGELMENVKDRKKLRQGKKIHRLICLLPYINHSGEKENDGTSVGRSVGFDTPRPFPS